MGSIVPIAFTALQAFQTVSSVANILSSVAQAESKNDLALRQLQEQQALQQDQAIEQAKLDKLELQQKTAEAEQQRKNALKRAVARQRAAFGSGGVSSENGSSEAVLLGLFEESEQEKENREQLDKLRNNAIDQNLENILRVNTLKRTQLKQKQKLTESASPFSTIEDLFKVF